MSLHGLSNNWYFPQLLFELFGLKKCKKQNKTKQNKKNKPSNWEVQNRRFIKNRFKTFKTDKKIKTSFNAIIVTNAFVLILQCDYVFK